MDSRKGKGKQRSVSVDLAVDSHGQLNKFSTSLGVNVRFPALYLFGPFQLCLFGPTNSVSPDVFAPKLTRLYQKPVMST